MRKINPLQILAIVHNGINDREKTVGLKISNLVIRQQKGGTDLIYFNYFF